MAIRKRGKSGLYSAYWRGLDERPDGTLVMVQRQACLYTDDLATARALDRQLREREAKHRTALRARAFARQLLDDSPDAPPVRTPVPVVEHRPRRLRLDSALDAAEKYAPISPTAAQLWRRFAKWAEPRACYMDELTPQMVHEYLSQYEKGKTSNQNRWAIGRICKLTRMDSGMTWSPADMIPSRRNDSHHQRPITEREFIRIYQAAPEPWRTACLIAWHTGLREIDVANLRWSEIMDDVIVHTPGKTARFGRAVRIPVHPQLAAALAEIPRVNEFVLGQWLPKGRIYPGERSKFSALLVSLGITDTPDGIVCFNSFRDSFATRMDAANIPRHATRGMLGHRADQTTDLYSHDIDTARRILDLPAPPLD